MLSLAQADLTDDHLISALNSASPSSIIVLEDVDAAFVERCINIIRVIVLTYYTTDKQMRKQMVLHFRDY